MATDETLFEEWDTTSGIDDEFDAKVIDARFDDGDYGVQLVLTLDNGDAEFDKYWGCGSKVQFKSEAVADCSALKGDTFHKRSAIGELISSLREHPEVLKQVAANGSPKEAANWVGLQARWKNHDRTGQVQGETKQWERLLVVGPYGGEVKEAEVEPPSWLVDLCVEHKSYDAFMEAALADERLDKTLRGLVLNESYWDFS